jgi:hypothetical protein
LISELQLEDAQQFRNFTRMSAVEVLNVLGPVTGKQDIAMRNTISVEERLIATLRFLATDT